MNRKCRISKRMASKAQKSRKESLVKISQTISKKKKVKPVMKPRRKARMLKNKNLAKILKKYQSKMRLKNLRVQP